MFRSNEREKREETRRLLSGVKHEKRNRHTAFVTPCPDLFGCRGRQENSKHKGQKRETNSKNSENSRQGDSKLRDICSAMTNEYDICLELMKIYGLRPAEVLSLRHERIIAGTMVFLGAKGSRDRFVRNEGILRAIERVCGIKEEGKVFTITRHMLYKECIRRGIVMRGRQRRRVTVAPRHLFVARLKDAGLPVSEIQEQVGHKRVQTTEYYINQR